MLAGMSRPRAAFSLVELSIVLVILGLLVGGILAGQSLIRASELRSVGTEASRWQTSTSAFRDKYFSIPGDMTNATSFWTGTANGDGSGFVEHGTNEMHRVWQHLALAGLVEGTFSGVAGGGGSAHVVIGTNAPASKLGNAGWSASGGSGFNSGNTEVYAATYGNYFIVGGQLAANLTAAAVLSPTDAWNIDTKLDDGKPARGAIMARYWDNGCAAADSYPTNNLNTNLDASYRLTDTTLRCALYFRKAF